MRSLKGIELLNRFDPPGMIFITTGAEQILHDMAILKRVVDGIEIALPKCQFRVMPMRDIAYLWERAASGVDGLDEGRIGDTDRVRTHANGFPVLSVESPLHLNLRLLVVDQEPPDVRELGKERTG